MTHSKSTVDRSQAERKARFLAALRIAGMSMDRWATEHGTTQGYVSNLLTGRRTNDVLNKKIAAFTEKQLRNVA